MKLCAACAPPGANWKRGANDVPPCAVCGRWDRPVRMTVNTTKAATPRQDRGHDTQGRPPAKEAAPHPQQETSPPCHRPAPSRIVAPPA